MKRFFILFAAIIIILFLLFNAPFKNPFVIRTDNFNPTCVERVNVSEIQLEPDRLVINIHNLSVSRYANTTSMIPFITENSTGITIAPQSPGEIKVGDIITYEKGIILIVHRVIEVGDDDEGWYCIVKGDNTQKADGKIRFNQIKSILVGILY